MLPAIALTDEVTGVVAAFATMVALHSGVGQVVDVCLLESLFQLMGPLISLYELTGQMQPRLGSGLPYSVPRGTYQCSDGRWIGVSTSSDSVAARVLNLLGVGGDPRFATFSARMEHRDALELVMTQWCAQRTQAEVIEAFTAAEAAIGPVMSMADIAVDPHYAARGAIADVEGTCGPHRPTECPRGAFAAGSGTDAGAATRFAQRAGVTKWRGIAGPLFDRATLVDGAARNRPSPLRLRRSCRTATTTEGRVQRRRNPPRSRWNRPCDAVVPAPTV